MLNKRLEAIRGLSAIVVFAGHTNAALFMRFTGPGSPSAALFEIMARHAVIVFFLLSGHLITNSVLSNARRGEFSAGNYVAARVARIYPPLFGAIGICSLVWWGVHHFGLPGLYPYGVQGDLYRIRDYFHFSGRDVVNALTMRGGMLDADGPLWSLFIEVQIYVVVLAIAAFWQRSWLTRLCCAALGLLAVRLLQGQGFWVLVWVIGAATAFMRISGKSAIITAAIAAGGALAVSVFHFSTLAVDTPVAHVVQALFAVAYAALMFYAPHRERYPTPILKTADFSYSLYIVHVPLLLLTLSLAQRWMGRDVLRTVMVATVSVAAIIAFAVAFAWLLERPQQFKHFLLSFVRKLTQSGESPASPM